MRRLFHSFYLLLVACMLAYTALAMGLRHSAIRMSLLEWLGVFLLLTLAISAAAYPLSRRITGRLARLRAAVLDFGAGNLQRRAAIEGIDEVADLARGFNDAAARIEALVAAHRRLLANASHELRTPLTRIRLGLELLVRDAHEARSAALRQDLRELDDLLEEILLASRLEAGAEPATTQAEVDVLALAAEEAARYPQTEVRVEPPWPENATNVLGDARLLRRLLRNLLENAHRHGAPPVEVRFAVDDQSLHIHISDHGPGVAAADRERVFEPFFRGRQTAENRGSGLGLALVKQIAERHRGRVECVATAAARSAFVVRLPRGSCPP